GVLGVDDVVLAARARRRRTLFGRRRRLTALAASGRARGAAVERLGHLVGGLLEPLERALEHLRVLGVAVVLDRVLAVLERRFELGAIPLRDLVAVLVEVLLYLEGQRLELVAGVD